jgi:methionyl-tRNA formyltransferase
MRIYFLTTDDRVFLPYFFDKVFSQVDYEVVGLALVKDPNFIRFLKNSLTFMGPRLFFEEMSHQLMIRCNGLVNSLFARSNKFSIKSVCSRYAIPVSTIAKINSDDFRSFLKAADVDVLVSVACPQILKKGLLSIPKLAAINIHYGLLPDYRGQYPSFWVLAQGEEFTGVSVHHMIPKVDAGDILVQAREKIRPDDTFYSLVGRLKTTIGPQALLAALDKIKNGDESRLENDPARGSYYSFPTRPDMARFRKRGRKWR